MPLNISDAIMLIVATNGCKWILLSNVITDRIGLVSPVDLTAIGREQKVPDRWTRSAQTSIRVYFRPTIVVRVICSN